MGKRLSLVEASRDFERQFKKEKIEHLKKMLAHNQGNPNFPEEERQKLEGQIKELTDRATKELADRATWDDHVGTASWPVGRLAKLNPRLLPIPNKIKTQLLLQVQKLGPIRKGKARADGSYIGNWGELHLGSYVFGTRARYHGSNPQPKFVLIRVDDKDVEWHLAKDEVADVWYSPSGFANFGHRVNLSHMLKDWQKTPFKWRHTPFKPRPKP